jgi:hypothetical protein
MSRLLACLACCLFATAVESETQGTVEIPSSIKEDLRPRRVIARHLDNPRGLHALPDGSLLVAEAGRGDADDPETSRLTLLTDVNRDGVYDTRGERRALLDKQRSINILEHVRRDEVFGMASIAAGGGRILATHAIFDGPSLLFEIVGDSVKRLGQAEGNLNSLSFDPRRGIWLAASSSRDQIVRVERDGTVTVIAKLANLTSGQQPVPAYVRFDERTGDTWVSLFSGSTEGETGGDGTEIQKRSAKVVRIDPDQGRLTDVITGLTVPTDFVLDEAGYVYVLEFCSDFLDPLQTRTRMWDRTSHGGFRRFSGRLLRVHRDRHEVTVLAKGLDAPTNVLKRGRTLLISEGMGTPGRRIPKDGGDVSLEGFISQVDLGAP